MRGDPNHEKGGATAVLFHRWFSLLLMVFLAALGLYAVAIVSLQSAVMYLFVCLTCLAVILNFFCSKCPCRAAGCAHFMFGPLAERLFSGKKGAYTRTDLLLTGAGFLGIIAFPQYWLHSERILFAIYWLCVALTVWEIKSHVCCACGNELCPAHKKNTASA